MLIYIYIFGCKSQCSCEHPELNRFKEMRFSTREGAARLKALQFLIWSFMGFKVMF